MADHGEHPAEFALRVFHDLAEVRTSEHGTPAAFNRLSHSSAGRVAEQVEQDRLEGRPVLHAK